MAAVEHSPDRPSWDCGACGKAWPCDPAREELVATHGRTERVILLWSYLEDALTELPPMPSREFMDRFLSWAR